MQDVIIENLEDAEVTVIAGIPVTRGEQMLLHVEDGDHGGSTIPVRGFERRPVVVDGQLRHRLRLTVVPTRKDGSV